MEQEAREIISHDDDDDDDEEEEDDEDEDEDDDPVKDSTATDVDVEDEEKQARHIECEELNEDTLLWVDNLEGLEIGYSKNWIKQRSACSFIRDSKSLRKIYIKIRCGDEDDGVSWLGELLQHVTHNRSIESLTIHLIPVIYMQNDRWMERSYDYRLEWDIFHMLTPFIEHNSNLRHIDLFLGTSAMLSSLALALSTCKNTQLQRINLTEVNAKEGYDEIFASLAHCSRLSEIRITDRRGIGPEGYRALSYLLENPASKIRKLELYYGLDDDSIATLSNCLIQNNSVKSLELARMPTVTVTGLETFYAVFSHPMCTIEKLWLDEIELDDECVTNLGEALADNTSVKCLDLSRNRSITLEGWRGFLTCMSNPHSSLEELKLVYCSIDDVDAFLLVSALDGNKSLKRLDMSWNHITSIGMFAIFTVLFVHGLSLEGLDLRECRISVDSLTDEIWLILLFALLNPSSIDTTFHSNHTLHSLHLDEFGECAKDYKLSSMFGFRDFGRRYSFDSFDDEENESDNWRDIKSSLIMNRNPNKGEVARQKILKRRFAGDESDICAFTCMPETLLPNALQWIGRSRDNLTYSMMFNVIQGVPTLLDNSD